MPCTLSYIPSHLHTSGRPDLNYFSIGEFLFRRCKEGNKYNPFDEISLIDISLNRRGPDPENILSDPEDVLFNTNPGNGKGEIINESIAYLEIKELDENNGYDKSYTHETITASGEKINNICRIILKHDKTPCIYAHCAFKIFLNGIETTFLNYKTGLGKQSQLRIWCKNELAKMYIKQEVRLNW